MKMLKLEVPDRVAETMEELVRAGWFMDESEIVRQALAEFVHRHRLQLQEEFQREDIRWALGLKEARR
jgi:Arc/MetJ-type ribon-helix-helix transcriptional regulator